MVSSLNVNKFDPTLSSSQEGGLRKPALALIASSATAYISEQSSPSSNCGAHLNRLTQPLSWSQAVDEKQDLRMLSERMQMLLELIAMHDKAFDEYLSYCEAESIEIDGPAVSSTSQLRKLMDELILRHTLVLSEPSVSTNAHFNKVAELDKTYRSLLNLQTSAARMLSWTAQTYRTSKIPQFFNGARTKKENVNYDRVQSARVNFVEQQLSQVYELNAESVELLVTCSGTAAYNVLEKYLSIHVLKPGDKILITPTMYDEHQDWAFRDTPHLEVITEDLYTTEAIIESIERTQPRVVMIDPLKNRQDARVTNVAAILNHLRDTWIGQEIYFLIDDTMLPGAINPFQEVKGNDRLKILLCSSGGKYLQIGQDVCMSGLVAYPRDMSKRMRNIRMFHGSILSDTAAWSYPNFDRKHHLARMNRMTRNALVFSEVFSSNAEFCKYFQAVFPGMKDHPDQLCASTLPFLGGTVNLRMLPRVENPKETLHDILDEMVIAVIEQAVKDGTGICWGEAVGFSIPRIGVHLEWLWRVPPYLRMVAGDRSLAETRLVAQSIVAALLDYMENNREKFLFGSVDDDTENQIDERINAQQFEAQQLGREGMGFFR